LRVGDKVTVQVVRVARADVHVSATVAASRHEAKKRMQKLMKEKTRRPATRSRGRSDLASR